MCHLEKFRSQYKNSLFVIWGIQESHGLDIFHRCQESMMMMTAKTMLDNFLKLIICQACPNSYVPNSNAKWYNPHF